MSSKAMSLKAKIRNYAKANRIAAQVVLQNYMFERFLARLSQSEYRDKFVIKSGMLIAAIVGLDTRSTMDLDTTVKGLPLTGEKVIEAVKDICRIDVGDKVNFETVSLDPIREDDPYGGFCVRFNAIYETIITPLSIDVSTGDVITPAAALYDLTGIFDNDLHIRLWGYNIETIMAEKAETILSRGVYNTRPRDYYDIYILETTQKYDIALFEEALNATAEHRGTAEMISDRAEIIERISRSQSLQNMWKKNQQRFSYAEKISYEEVMAELNKLLLKK